MDDCDLIRYVDGILTVTSDFSDERRLTTILNTIEDPCSDELIPIEKWEVAMYSCCESGEPSEHPVFYMLHHYKQSNGVWRLVNLEEFHGVWNGSKYLFAVGTTCWRSVLDENILETVDRKWLNQTGNQLAIITTKWECDEEDELDPPEYTPGRPRFDLDTSWSPIPAPLRGESECQAVNYRVVGHWGEVLTNVSGFSDGTYLETDYTTNTPIGGVGVAPRVHWDFYYDTNLRRWRRDIVITHVDSEGECVQSIYYSNVYTPRGPGIPVVDLKWLKPTYVKYDVAGTVDEALCNVTCDPSVSWDKLHVLRLKFQSKLNPSDVWYINASVWREDCTQPALVVDESGTSQAVVLEFPDGDVYGQFEWSSIYGAMYNMVIDEAKCLSNP